MIKAEDLISKFRYAYDNAWGYIYGMKHVLWTEARQKNYDKAKADNSDCQNSIKYGPKWYGHYVTDCSGLFSWAFEELGGYMYHGSNTMYTKYCTAKGTLKNGKKSNGKALKPGTAVFCKNESTGRRTHVGLYIGGIGNNVIEAAGARQGVIKSKLTDSKWDDWGELEGVSYEEEAPESGQPAETDEKNDALPTLRRGSKGADVKKAQELLKKLGYSLGSAGVDGDFGPAMEKAVKAFQKDWGLKQDGIIGPDTWKILQSAPEKEKKYTVTIKGLTLDKAKALVKEYTGASYKEE